VNLFLEPVDVWLFRDGRPFSAGTEHSAETVFPPPPTVVQGALRSHHLAVKGVDLADRDAVRNLVGDAEQGPPGFRVRGPFVATRAGSAVRLWFPRPSDCIRREGRILALTPQPPREGWCASVPAELPQWLVPPDQPTKEDEADFWMSIERLQEYLDTGSCPDLDATNHPGDPAKDGVVRREALFSRERRIGIALNGDTRTVRMGLLYEVEFARLARGCGLYVEAEGLEGWPARGVLRLGGESRGAVFEQVEPCPWPEVPDPLPERFKLYFATPARFERGWLPRTWSAFLEGDVELVACALQRYVTIGGFDLSRGEEKPARRFVPAGSVYFFRGRGPCRLRWQGRQDGGRAWVPAVTDDGAAFGFGQVLVGRW